jgi:hypothetical protein
MKKKKNYWLLIIDYFFITKYPPQFPSQAKKWGEGGGNEKGMGREQGVDKALSLA